VPTQNPNASYRRIADDLREAIRAGDFPRGARLPGTRELAERYNVGASTVVTAVGLLRSEGLVSGIRGGPTFVNETREIHRFIPDRYRRDSRERSGGRGAFDSETRALGMNPRSDMTLGRSAASDEVAELLQIRPGDPVVTRSRKMYADDVPVQLAVSYIPATVTGEAGDALTDSDSGLGGIVSRFAELGLAQVRMTEAWRIGYANSDQAGFLRVEPGSALWLVNHIGWTAAGIPVELCQHVMPANWVSHVEFTV
jgi:GntR family transcriptional regulator